MRRMILFLVFLMFLFLINVIFYFLSEDYQFFLKKVKNNDEIVYINDKIINDSIELTPNVYNSNKNTSNKDVIKFENTQKSFQDKINDEIENNEVKIIGEVNKKIIQKESKTVLGKNYQEILQIFSQYSLKQMELPTNLFDITDEYPDSYYEFYSPEITLYFFDTKTYNEVYDIFDILAYDLPFAINEVNNFGNQSFYINLNEDIKDNYVRLVINYRGVVYGVKIKSREYNNIRDSLATLKK